MIGILVWVVENFDGFGYLNCKLVYPGLQTGPSDCQTWRLKTLQIDVEHDGDVE